MTVSVSDISASAEVMFTPVKVGESVWMTTRHSVALHYSGDGDPPVAKLKAVFNDNNGYTEEQWASVNWDWTGNGTASITINTSNAYNDPGSFTLAAVSEVYVDHSYQQMAGDTATYTIESES